MPLTEKCLFEKCRKTCSKTSRSEGEESTSNWSEMMDELEETHSRKAPAVELFPNELQEERIEKLTDLELSKKMIVAFQNWLWKKIIPTSPPWCCGHWPKNTRTWSYWNLNSNLEKFLPLRGEEKTTYCHHTVLQVRQESGCSVYCYGIRLSEVTQDQWTWGLCWHVLRELPHRIASAPPVPMRKTTRERCRAAPRTDKVLYAAQRHPFFSFNFFLLRNISTLRLGEAKRNKICHRHITIVKTCK